MQGGQDAGEALKLVAQELQAVMSQMQTVNSQISELSMTLEALSSQDPEKPVYRAVGSLLLEVSDRNSLASQIIRVTVRWSNSFRDRKRPTRQDPG